MRYETYLLETRESMMTFEFISKGPKGSVKKRVQYTKFKQGNFYNLAFGDVNKNNDIDDKTVTHNNDTHKVLATVAKTVYTFLEKYPNAAIYVKGSTFARTRLYRMIISNNLEEINEQFKVFGFFDDKGWVVYEKNNDYSAFLVILKK